MTLSRAGPASGRRSHLSKSNRTSAARLILISRPLTVAPRSFSAPCTSPTRALSAPPAPRISRMVGFSGRMVGLIGSTVAFSGRIVDLAPGGTGSSGLGACAAADRATSNRLKTTAKNAARRGIATTLGTLLRHGRVLERREMGNGDADLCRIRRRCRELCPAEPLLARCQIAFVDLGDLLVRRIGQRQIFLVLAGIDEKQFVPMKAVADCFARRG